MTEHPVCILNKCKNYPCRILDPILDRNVICNNDGFWEEYFKKEEKKDD